MRSTAATPNPDFPAWLNKAWHAEDWRYTPVNRFAPQAAQGTTHTSTPLCGHGTLRSANGKLPDMALPNGMHVEDGGKTLRIRAGATIETPIEIIHTLSGHVERSIIIEENAQVFMVEQLGTADYATCRSRITLGKGAAFSYLRLCDVTQNTSLITQDEFHLDTNATQKFHTVNLCAGSLRQNILATLSGSDAHFNLGAVNAALTGGHADMLTDIQHIAAHASSEQNIRSLAKEKAKAVFQGKITVAQGAQKTNASQNHRGLLLGEHAEIDAKPSLEIYADDVKCAHGNTCGALDEDALFYLRSRGIPKHTAEALLQQAFIAQLFETLDEDLRENLLQRITEKTGEA